ncbi:MAG TPA: hypothetical protein EYG85_05485 [Crocinitomix sp.]|nr:hypothetical protein [Crocinitomix sp.]
MKYYLITLVIFTSLISCKMFKKNKSVEQNKIEILWEKNLGMIGGYESIYLSKDSCMYYFRQKGNDAFIKFNIEQLKLLDLYNTFIEHKFSLIKSTKQEVYDRGGTKITLTVNDVPQTVNNSGMYFIKPEYKTNYKAIEDKIKEVAFEIINQHKKNVEIKLSDELVNSKYILYLYVNNKEVYSELNGISFSPIKMKLFDTYNTFKITLMEKGSTYNTIKGNYEVTVDKLPTDNQIILTIDNNTLKVK